MSRSTFSSTSPWEPVVGYARAVRVGDQIWVSGTTATSDDGELVGKDDAYAQAVRAIENLDAALRMAGAGLRDVVRTRIYVVDIKKNAESVGRAHAETFHDIRPASTMIEVAGLIDPDMLVEIEADAVID